MQVIKQILAAARRERWRGRNLFFLAGRSSHEWPGLFPTLSGSVGAARHPARRQHPKGIDHE
jgi:hypothetical protein